MVYRVNNSHGLPESGNRMHIVADENIPFVKDAFASFGEVTTLPGRAISHTGLREAEILLVRSVTSVDEALLHDTPIRFVASATIGIDHIDREYLQKSGIGFAYAPGSNADSVAQYIVASLAVMARRKELRLESLTLGIVGVGNIGSRVFKHAHTLGMQTLLCDPPKQRLNRNTLYRPLDEILAGSDIISLHVPLILSGPDRTELMVDESFIRRMKEGAVLINTSRGRMVNETALFEHRNRLGGLVLDVWNNEPSINTGLVAIADLATPHIAGYSFDGKVRGTMALHEAACTYFSTEPRWHPLSDPVAGYPFEIDIGGGVDPLLSAILQAYSIENDDQKLRKITTFPKEEQSSYFDGLRKNYPKRYEFRHYNVKAGRCPAGVMEKLKLLGFGVES